MWQRRRVAVVSCVRMQFLSLDGDRVQFPVLGFDGGTSNSITVSVFYPDGVDPELTFAAR